jgi:hypothetical protein
MQEDNFKKIPTGSLPIPTAFSVPPLSGTNAFFSPETIIPDSKKAASRRGRKPGYHLPGMENIHSGGVPGEVLENETKNFGSNSNLARIAARSMNARLAMMSPQERINFYAGLDRKKAKKQVSEDIFSQNPIQTIPIIIPSIPPLPQRVLPSIYSHSKPKKERISVLPSSILDMENLHSSGMPEGELDSKITTRSLAAQLAAMGPKEKVNFYINIGRREEQMERPEGTLLQDPVQTIPISVPSRPTTAQRFFSSTYSHSKLKKERISVLPSSIVNMENLHSSSVPEGVLDSKIPTRSVAAKLAAMSPKELVNFYANIGRSEEQMERPEDNPAQDSILTIPISTLSTPLLQRVAPSIYAHQSIPVISSLPSYTASTAKPSFRQKKDYCATNLYPYTSPFLDTNMENPVKSGKTRSRSRSVFLTQSGLNHSTSSALLTTASPEIGFPHSSSLPFQSLYLYPYLSGINLYDLNKKIKKSLPIPANDSKSESGPEDDPEPVTQSQSKPASSVPVSENRVTESASKSCSETPVPTTQDPGKAEKEPKDLTLPSNSVISPEQETKSTSETRAGDIPVCLTSSRPRSSFSSNRLAQDNNQDIDNKDEKSNIQHDKILVWFKDQVLRLADNDSSLIELNLEQIEINFEYMQEIAHSLKNNYMLKTLVLNQSLTDDCLVLLAEALRKNTTLLVLSLENRITSWSVALPKIKACIQRNNLLAKSTITTKQLKKLDLVNLEEQDLKVILDKHPLKELDFSQNNLDINSMSHFFILNHFTFITILKLNMNNLNDESIQLLSRFLEINLTLSHLHLTHNQITEAGAEELLNATRNIPPLKTLNLSHNLMYVIPMIFKRLEKPLKIRSEEKAGTTEKLNINVSQNYFTAECDELLLRHSIFNSVGTYREYNRVNRATGFSLILKEAKIDYDNYLVFLLRKNGQDRSQQGNTQHAMILVEGMYENGQKFIHMYDFGPDQKHPGLGEVREKAYIPYRLFAQVYGYDYVCYPAKRVKFMSLKNNIEMDKTKNLYYKKISTGATSGSSCNRTYNCLTWAIVKLNESIMPLGEKIHEPAFLPIPSLYLRGQRVIYTNEQKEEMCDGDTDPSSSQRSCRLM